VKEALQALAEVAGIALERVRRTHVLSQLNEAAKALTGALDLSSVKEGVVKCAETILQANAVVLYLYDRERDVVELPPTMWGVRQPEFLKTGAFSRDSVSMRIIHSGKSRYASDSSKDRTLAGVPRPADAPAPFVQREGIVSSAGVLLKVMGEVVGVLFVNYRRHHAFGPREREKIELFAGQAATAIKNALRLEEERRLSLDLSNRIEDLETLHAAGREMSGELNVDRLCDILLDKVNETLKCSHSTLFRVDSSGALYPCSRRGARLEDIKDLRFPIGQGLAGWVAEYKRVALVPDVNNDPRFQLGRTQPPGAPHAMLVAPILLRNQDLFGVVSLDKDVIGGFDEHDRRLLETIVSHAATAIENARLYTEVSRRAKQLKILLDNNGRIITEGVKDVDRLPDLLYEIACEVMDLSDAQVQFAFYDADKNVVTFPLAVEQDDGRLIDRIRWGVRERKFVRPGEDEIVPAFQPRSRGSRFGLTEYVIHTRSPILIAENFWERANALRIGDQQVRVLPTFGRRERPTHSWLGVPMIVQEQVLGVISIQSLEQERAFDQEQVEILSTVANQAAVAIANARLIVSEREWARTMGAIQRAGLDMVSKHDLREVLETVVQSANDAFSAAFSTLFTYDAEHDTFEMGVRRGKIAIDPEIPSVTGLAARIAKTGESIFAANEEEARAFGVRPTMIEEKSVKAFAGVPLMFREKSVGVLFVNFFQEHDFSNREREAIALLANQAAAAIENARLVDVLRKKLDELKLAQNRLLTAERLTLMSQVAAEFIHRLGNLIGTIPVRIALIKEKLDLTEARDRAILRIIEGISSDTEGLLRFARDLERPTGKLSPELVDINQAVRTAIIQQGIPSSVRLEENLAADLPEIAVPKDRFLQTLKNLIGNALDAMPQGGTLTITTSLSSHEERRAVQLDVTDTGIGISPDDQKRIFELFYSTKRDGLGYGLWRDKNLIESLGGKIVVRSQLGQGSTFTLLIPVAG
jgi:GAF domain-containing protein